MRAQRPRRTNSRNRFDVATAYGRSRLDDGPPLISRRVRIQLLVLLGLIAALYFGSRYLMSDRFAVREVNVLGNGGVSVGQIQQAAGLTGQHVLMLNVSPNMLQEAADRVRTVPGVEKSQISCMVDPAPACTVVVQPAPPLALFKASTGNMWIDREGRVQRAYEDMSAAITLQVEDPASQFDFGAQLPRFAVRALTEIAMNADVAKSEMIWSKEAGITLIQAPRNQRVRLGVAERDGAMAAKIALAEQMRAALASMGKYPRIIDVRFLEAPFYVE